MVSLLAAVLGLAFEVHSLTDIGHEFTFYFDGRFSAQYLPGGKDARQWATLSKAKLDDVNLLVLSSGGTPCPYTPKDVAKVRSFVRGGGGVVILGDYATFRDEQTYQLNSMAQAFGAQFLDIASTGPIKAYDKELKTYGAKALELSNPQQWNVVATDTMGHPEIAWKKYGDGRVLVASRSLVGHNPDASDPINDWLWRPLLEQTASGKDVDPKSEPQGDMPELVEERQGLRIRSNEYMKPWADSVFSVYKKVRPVQEKVLGVPPSKGMMTSLILLPTGGGGFSDGTNIALGVWWGDFPKQQYGMVELLGHEATHSWVLPHPEPMWNEGLATYVGITLGKKLGMTAEAEASLRGSLDSAAKSDPKFDKLDLTKDDIPHAVSMGKPMWIFEQLSKEKPDILSRYFQAKRKLAPKDSYTADDCVAVLSVAAGRNLFPWFKSMGISVDPSRTKVQHP